MPRPLAWIRSRVPEYPFLNIRGGLIFFSVIPIFFWSFILAGCTSSNGLRNIYLFALSYKKSPAPTVVDSLLINGNITHILESQISQSDKIIQEVRVGYLSLCVAFDSGIWSCSTNVQELVTLVTDGNDDPLNILRLAERVRTGTFFYALIIITLVFISIVICLVSTFPGWHAEVDSEGSDREVRPFPSRPILQCALLLSLLASLLGLASAFWQHIGGAGASTLTRLLTYDLVAAQIGPTSLVLGWIAAGLNAVVTGGLILMHLSTTMLTRLA